MCFPYEGRYDAQPLALFSVSNNKQVTAIPQANLAAIKGQVRDIKWISRNGHKLLLVARNNEQLMAFKKK